MVRPFARSLVVLSAFLILKPCVAKSPEDFVGPAPAQAPATQPPPAPAKTAPKAAAPAPATAAAPAPAAKPATAPAAAKTARPPAAKPVLDTATLHATYLNGDFDVAIKTMEGALRGKRPLTHADSVFIFKHLGVMYAATPATREKGRYYMLQLINVEPTAKILDMYASDMIYLIFRNVQEEYETKHGRAAVEGAPAVDTTPAPAPQPAVAAAPAPAPAAAPSNGRNKTLYWVAGGTAVAAGTAALLFILLDDPQPKKHEIVLNE